MVKILKIWAHFLGAHTKSAITFCRFLRKKVKFWKEFPLSSMKNPRSSSVYVFGFVYMLQKSIIFHGISLIILHKFWPIFFHIFRRATLPCFYGFPYFLKVVINFRFFQIFWYYFWFPSWFISCFLSLNH